MEAPSPGDLESGIVNLQEIQQNERLKLAHARWLSLEAKLDECIAHDLSQVSNVSNEIYQLLGFASAFQGLLLTAVAQASQLKCHNVGIPLALSLFATVVTLAGVWQKKGIITKLETNLSTNKEVREEYQLKLQRLEQEGNDFRNTSKAQDAGQDASTAGRCSSKWETFNTGVIVCILILGGICSFFIYRVLCDA